MVNAYSLLERDSFNVDISFLIKGSFATVYRCHSKKHEDSYVSLLLIYCVFVLIAGFSDKFLFYFHKSEKIVKSYINTMFIPFA